MDFYIVDEDYISYLQDYERKHRNGITRVPNVRYADRNKFSFGAVLTINDISYYVAVSSFKTKQEANILILAVILSYWKKHIKIILNNS